ncbi:hypothetical protein P8452_53136 [Trifolium repens]|nr:hypothetical protein P8452_53136 [Trifolium repens]
MYLPERVLRQFSHVQSIPRHLRESAPPFLTAPATTLITISLHFSGFMERVLTAAQRGSLAIDPWYAVAGYMRWYLKYSHPYMTPLSRGDPPRPCEREAIMEEQADMVGPLTSRLEGKLTVIRGIADKILAFGDDGFHRPINEISCEGTTGTIQIHYRWFDSETKILLLSNCISSPYRNR